MSRRIDWKAQPAKPKPAEAPQEKPSEQLAEALATPELECPACMLGSCWIHSLDKPAESGKTDE